MRHVLKVFTVVTIFSSTWAFAGPNGEVPSDPLCSAPICARIDGYPFDFKNQDYFSASMNATNDAVLFTFCGNDVKDKSGNYNEQKITVEVPVKALAKGFVTTKKVQYEFNKQMFYSLPRETDFFITDLAWSNDKSSFTVTASFETTVKKTPTPEVNEPVLGIKGQFENITVSVPTNATALK